MRLKRQILHDWPAKSPVAEICLRLLRALKRAPLSDHYSFAELQAMASAGPDANLASALLYLSNENLQILKLSLMYEHREGYLLDLPESELDAYARGEQVVHPDLGTPIDNSEILISFLPGEQLQKKSVRRATK